MQDLIKEIEEKKVKMDELAFSAEGRRLSNKYEKLNFLREALISAVEQVSVECDMALVKYCQYVGIQIAPDRLARVLEAERKKRKEKQKDGIQ